MIDILAGEFERPLMTAIIVSGVLALLIVAGVGLVWWRAGRWVNTGRRSLRTLGSDHRLLAQGPEPEEVPGKRPYGSDAGATSDSGSGERGRTEQERASRWVTEAAARAGTLRNAWERSYREARASREPSVDAGPGTDLEVLIAELLREQRETNRLLREVAERLDRALR